jgi:hypothetical protein
MSAESKKSMGGTILLILFGIIALVAGASWLVVLIPAAMLVWFGDGILLRSGRN